MVDGNDLRPFKLQVRAAHVAAAAQLHTGCACTQGPAVGKCLERVVDWMMLQPAGGHADKARCLDFLKAQGVLG